MHPKTHLCTFFLELITKGSIENLRLHWGVDELKGLRSPAVDTLFEAESNTQENSLSISP